MDGMRWIYLSPHLDDAALSAGGLIYEQTQAGIPVEIWTFMCGNPHLKEYSPLTQAIHKMWNFSDSEEAVRERRKEDMNAAGILGAKAVHFDFLDCIYRRGKNGEWLYTEEVFGELHPEDADLPAQIAAAIAPRLQPDDVLVAQLSVGSHVDHVLVRQAAELLGGKLIYDIDMPYFLYKSDEFEAKAAGMKESISRITEASLERWQDAVVEYKSQLPALNEAVSTPERARASIRAYWDKWGGIRLLKLD
jgi:LmbE family N-acetylglucosaminyl deacetylase